MIPERSTFTAWLYLAIAVSTIVDFFQPQPILENVTSAMIVLFLVFEFGNLPRAQQIAGLVLIVVGIAGAASSSDWQDVLLDGIARSRAFLLLFFAVSWLQFPVSRSPALRAVRQAIINQPSGRRFLFLSFGVHVLGSVLNLAGLSLLTVMVEEQKDKLMRRRLSLALMQGFTSASLWSPFYIGMVVVLVALPSLSWQQVAPGGAALAAVLMVSSWAYDRVMLRQRGIDDGVRKKFIISKSDMLRAFVIMALLMSSVMILAEIASTSIPVTLGLVGPIFSAVWYWAIQRSSPNALRHTGAMVVQVVAGSCMLRNEAMMFVAANVFGVGLASAIPAGDLSAAVNNLICCADLKLLAIILTFLLSAMMGLHPVIIVIFFATVLPPASIGLSDWTVGLIYLACWGLSTQISPVSGTNLFMSRVAKVPPHIISWRWAPPSTFLGAFVVYIIVITIRHTTM